MPVSNRGSLTLRHYALSNRWSAYAERLFRQIWEPGFKYCAVCC